MKQDKLSRCIGNIDEKFINEAENYRKKNKGIWVKWSAAVACMCLIIAVAIPLVTKDNKQSQVIKDNPNVPDETNETNDMISDNYDVYVPKLQLPKNASAAQMDMIGLFVYQGRSYTQSKRYSMEEAREIEGLVGEYIGHAIGNIDEWSNQDEYAVEFASTVEGDVYSVKGYSTQFRLCMKGSYSDENGNTIAYINFYENLNGIGLTNGKDLFEERLNLSGNWNTVKCQEHENWNNEPTSNYVYHDLVNVMDEDINTFIKELCESKFEYVYETNPNIYDDSVKQKHLYFYMNDNTVAELRLFEGGYVGYQHLGWYFVKMPSEIFELIFSACK
ncbi:hypothetical protein [Anaerosporobacter sp.]|uniref:hypothetical protein n=1 Tax=Anaerosporobacter sp. TaxID=1872529 RepID=UPI00286F4677|nr:hypothetical protein [Anaerosporobacter sp.]